MQRFLAFALILGLGGASAAAAAPLHVVAAENFYGNVVQQLGGEKVHVTSILSDPNIDPHEYESSFDDAKAVATADLVIENAGGYDDWLDKLLSGSPRGSRILLKGFDLAPTKLPDNEHVWYSVDNMQAIAQAITDALKKLDAADAPYFTSRQQAFTQALTSIRKKLAEMKARWQGTPVALTETIFLYQTGPLGLSVLTPLEFQKAIAEGNDPPTDTVVTAEDQVKTRKVKALIYNEQTISPITTRLQDDAKAAGVPVVPVTETMPSAMTYQTWMLFQLAALDKALGGG